MHTGYARLCMTEKASHRIDVKFLIAAAAGDIRCIKIGVRVFDGEGVGFGRDSFGCLYGAGTIGVDECKILVFAAVGVQICAERGDDIVHRSEEIDVIEFTVQDHAHGRVHGMIRIFVLTRLKNRRIAVTGMISRTERRDHGAGKNGGIGVGMGENVCKHTGCGGFSVCSGNTDRMRIVGD